MWSALFSHSSSDSTQNSSIVNNISHKPLDYRKKHRFDAVESVQTKTSYQPSIDKVSFVL